MVYCHNGWSLDDGLDDGLDNSLDDAQYNAGDDFRVQNSISAPAHSHTSSVARVASLKASDAKASLNFRWGCLPNFEFRTQGLSSS